MFFNNTLETSNAIDLFQIVDHLYKYTKTTNKSKNINVSWSLRGPKLTGVLINMTKNIMIKSEFIFDTYNGPEKEITFNADIRHFAKILQNFTKQKLRVTFEAINQVQNNENFRISFTGITDSDTCSTHYLPFHPDSSVFFDNIKLDHVGKVFKILDFHTHAKSFTGSDKVKIKCTNSDIEFNTQFYNININAQEDPDDYCQDETIEVPEQLLAPWKKNILQNEKIAKFTHVSLNKNNFCIFVDQRHWNIKMSIKI